MKKMMLLAVLLVGLALPAWSRPNQCHNKKSNQHYRQRSHHNRGNTQRYGRNYQSNRCPTNYRAGYNYRNFGNYRPFYSQPVYRPTNARYRNSCGGNYTYRR
ncbi:MAG: hypothetical protein AB7S38_19740 [Vulcanimicrobiota bacterium]